VQVQPTCLLIGFVGSSEFRELKKYQRDFSSCCGECLLRKKERSRCPLVNWADPFRTCMYAIEYEIKSQDENSREEEKKKKTDQTDFFTVFRHLI
jgi:hypothetical protein